MKENFAMSKVYSDEVQTSKMKFVSQEPHLDLWQVSDLSLRVEEVF